jgi:hypothetical protein
LQGLETSPAHHEQLQVTHMGITKAW